MNEYTGLTLEGRPWKPRFIHSLDTLHCIGCGRCLKVCGQNVFSYGGITRGRKIVPFGDPAAFMKVMLITDPGSCIGCQACSRVCPKELMEHRTRYSEEMRIEGRSEEGADKGEKREMGGVRKR